jgi:prepilin-type processing-associated H-X9-DG protein
MNKKRGMTIIEMLVVIAQISLLVMLLMPALAKARETARRSNCVNNLKQFGLVFKMYSNESQSGQFPAGRLFAPFPRQASFAFDSSELYPEYWVDPELARCPSDAGGDIFGNTYGIEKDFSAQIERITKSTAGTEQEYNYCLHSKLSTPISYCYTPYLATSMSQLVDIHSIQQWATDNIIDVRRDLTNPTGAFHGLEHIDASCTGYLPFNGLYSSIISLNGFEPGQHDITPDLQYRLGIGLDDDGMTPLNRGYKRLKEGIERFVITDINNPGAAQSSQSEIVILWDAYAYGRTKVTGFETETHEETTFQFNHIPDGSNVLFMDGHVEFIKINQGYPMNVTVGISPNSLAGSQPDSNYPNFFLQDLGNWGGFG